MKTLAITGMFLLCLTLIQAETDLNGWEYQTMNNPQTAQVSQKIRFGATGGLNIASITMDDTNLRICPHIGLFMQYYFNEQWIIQPEILYTKKGWTQSRTISDDEYYLKLKEEGILNYFEIPLLIKYNTALEKFILQPYLGISIGILSSAKLKIKWDIMGLSDTENIKDRMEDLDLALNLGADALLTDRFFLGARFTHGLTKIMADTESDDNINNRNIMIRAGVLF